MAKRYRFFFHYNKPLKKMTVHFRGQCLIAKDVRCEVPCTTKWNKTQPQIVMRGWAAQVVLDQDIIFIGD